MASWGYALSLLFANSALKTAADIPDAVANFTDLSMAAEDYGLAADHLAHIDKVQNAALFRRMADTGKEAFIRMIKAIASVAGAALGLLVLAFGGPILPAAALLGVSLLSTIASMWAYFFKATRPYEIVEFFKPRESKVY